jgi:DNA-binding HxlR family transcriptional regulator
LFRRASLSADGKDARIPPRVDYELTRLGRSLLEPVSELGTWARKNRAAIVAARERFDGGAT